MINKTFGIGAFICASACFAADSEQMGEIRLSGALSQAEITQISSLMEDTTETKEHNRTVSIDVDTDGLKETAGHAMDVAKREVNRAGDKLPGQIETLVEKTGHAAEVADREVDRAIEKAPDQLNTGKVKAKAEGKRVEKKHIRGKFWKKDKK